MLLFLAKEADLLHSFLKTLSRLPLPYLKSLQLIHTKGFDEHYLTWFCSPNIPELEKITLRLPKKRVPVKLDSSSTADNKSLSLCNNLIANQKMMNITTVQIHGGYAALRDLANQCAFILELDSRYPFVFNTTPGSIRMQTVKRSVRNVYSLIVLYCLDCALLWSYSKMDSREILIKNHC